MDIMRRIMEEGYLLSKPAIFYLTKSDPEKAHEKIIQYANFLNQNGLDKFLFEHSDNNKNSNLKISNAAGFNKNGDIPPLFLKYLGFDRVVIGTVTHEKWEGNPRPRITRYPDTESIINQMGLPGEGSGVIAERLMKYGDKGVPLTINLMSTPKKEGDELIKDLEGTVLDIRNVPGIDRWELNISCPNTTNKYGKIDARKEYFKQMPYMLTAVKELILPSQELNVKISPDLGFCEIIQTIAILENYSIPRVVIGNTTTNHNPEYISVSPGKGGASGKAVYESSLNVQKTFNEIIYGEKLNLKITACGGIDSIGRLIERINEGADEIQIYTPLIFKGPKLIRELRKVFG